MKDHLAHLKALAQTATASGPDKWAANTELISWFRSDPVAIIEALESGAEVLNHHGGLSKTRMAKAYERLPKVAA